MVIVGPGETITVSQSGIPTGQTVGIQVIKAATGAVSLGRFTIDVVERPSGSGNYVSTFVAPVEADLYLVVLDWNNGVLTPTKSVVQEMQVTSSVLQADTGLGEIADYVKTYIGGETFTLLLESPNYGPSFISLAIDVIKHRMMTSVVLTINENTLPVVVLSYFGKLAALQLMSAVRDIWSTKAQSKALGNDPVETISYPSRTAILDAIEESLLRQVREEQAAVLPLIPTPNLILASRGPAIDEDEDDGRVTSDPRVFPRLYEFPYRDGVIFSRNRAS
jgi:hypothetical protein